MVLRVMVSSIDTIAYGGQLSIVPRCEGLRRILSRPLDAGFAHLAMTPA